MATRHGPKSCNIIGKVITVVFLIATLISEVAAKTVEVDQYDTFWLWAGVKPQPALGKAHEIYLLAGEVSGHPIPHIISQRSATPHIKGPALWIVYRANTLMWDERVMNDVMAHLEAWQHAGNKIAGLQIDFDAGTKHLDRYAVFLKSIRQRLPRQFKLSITGLLDWSTNGKSTGLAELGDTVDEVVLQIYQGRHVIDDYQKYLEKLATLHLPFRIGLLQEGDWQAPTELATNPFFKGYVVFLLNPL